ncbi:MAG: hypothetical protein DYH13_06675 [Alphaproteobacteria bacterium PRO2]|nr:hypothetical protein [Alphaproteobacteria bacterium PRO2]
MSKQRKEELKKETCEYPGFESSDNFYDFIYQHRERPDLWEAANFLINKSGPALYHARANFVLLCTTDSEVKKRATVKMAISELKSPSPSGMD